MEIRKLTEADYDLVVQLYYELDALHFQARPDYFIPRDRDNVYPKDAYLRNLSCPETLELGAFDGSQLAGVVSATLWDHSGMVRDAKTVFLENIYVLETYRRQGVAKKLFSAVESWAKEQGAVRLDLYVWDFNENAIALYQSMGMTPQRHVLEKKLT